MVLSGLLFPIAHTALAQESPAAARSGRLAASCGAAAQGERDEGSGGDALSASERSQRIERVRHEISGSEARIRFIEKTLEGFHTDIRDYNRARIAADLAAAAASFSFAGLTVALMTMVPSETAFLVNPFIASTGTLGGLAFGVGFLMEADDQRLHGPTAEYSQLTKITEYAFDLSSSEVLRFLSSDACYRHCSPCSPVPLRQLTALYRQVETDYREARQRIDLEAPEDRLEFFSQRSSLILRAAEVPRAEAVLAIERAKLGFFRRIEEALYR